MGGTAGRIVRGLLIADVTPVTPAASRLVQVDPAPRPRLRSCGRRRAPRPGSVASIAIALIVALFALGAGRELRGRRRWRELRAAP